MGNNEKIFIVTVHEDKKRIDIYLSEKFPDLSRTKIQNLIKNRTVLINAQVCKPSKEVKKSDIVKITIPQEEPLDVIPQNFPLNILYEDKCIIAINKPKGTIVCPTQKIKKNTLVNYLLFNHPEISSIGGNQRCGILHRLDRDTTGVLLVAKDNDTFNNISSQFKERKIEKYYLAITVGILPKLHQTINKPVGRDFKNGKKMRVDGRKSRTAITHYKVIKFLKHFTLVLIKPITGRTHQIRIHLSNIGYPIVGDKTYGKTSKIKNYVKSTKLNSNLISSLSGQLLHAYKISFYHPLDNKKISVAAPIPTQMENFINIFSANWNIKDEKLFI